ncbi:hypothetical protein WJX81_007407 [Elliptochloris bilobata]|uniref:Sulfotransferase family protein n=1 Tax=Elliptochloris bilobata TaxID=381761 RepID=A0AAW1QIZ0_9CHLO
MKGCQVIGAGWCRTGTSTLQVALEQLGFTPCFHSRFLPYLPDLRNACYAYSKGQTRAFPVERVFGRYVAAVDLPAALTPLLLDAYPHAKVVLTDGWEPLCRFLGVDIPARPFPPPQNEGAGAMLRQLARFWWRHPLAALGLREYDHRDKPLDMQAL